MTKDFEAKSKFNHAIPSFMLARKETSQQLLKSVKEQTRHFASHKIICKHSHYQNMMNIISLNSFINVVNTNFTFFSICNFYSLYEIKCPP